ncbi:MAG: UDP-3-O-[3-hydroxymyristoyl] N-acetylglucosamine deacetylase [Synechococcaceae cyanobacterium SM2_3_2]|nr:UDP-3-O-[3-hydroxymyristoyl] N-acetylglucosamine deacetylase [Synechococcaceae cyanobacterium SM2_3_2]
MSFCLHQRTLSQSISLAGIGLHSGDRVNCHLHPAEVNHGRVFVRTDLSDSPSIRADLKAVQPAALSTYLVHGYAGIQTTEHLLAALAGLGIDNCQIEVSGAELPILDGSALPWVTALLQAGIQAQSAPRQVGILSHPVTVGSGPSFVSALPYEGLRLTYGIDFPDSPIRDQWHSWEVEAGSFASTIAPARTFTREQDIEPARRNGLIKGGSLENALVCDLDSWRQPLRFEDEPVRHKLIDLLGDLSLLGYPIRAHILAYKAGHSLHHQLSQRLLDSGALTLVTAESQPQQSSRPEKLQTNPERSATGITAGT